MMSRRPRISIEVLIGLAALACFIVIAVLDHERQQRSVESYDTFSTTDYRSGGYHAWYDMLQREGVSVQRFQRRPGYLNSDVSTFVVANNTFETMLRTQAGEPAGFYGERDYDALQKWIMGGGRLIWIADRENSLKASSMVPKSLSQFDDPEILLQLPPVRSVGPTKDSAVSILPSPFTSGVRSVSGSERLRVPLAQSFDVSPLVADDTGAVAAWYRIGRGAVIVITDESLFENKNLAKADNARLAYDVAAAALPPHAVVAFDEWTHGYQSGDTWWSILPVPLRWAFIIFCAAMVVALVGGTIRFGPAVRLPENTERTSEEYLLSMASLLHRGDATRKGVRDLAAMALHDVAQALGLPDSTKASGLAARLRGSERGDRLAGDVMTLDRLAGYEHPSAAELVRAADICIALRKEFAAHGPVRIGYRGAARRRAA